jgi:hypothetical protein
VTPPNAGLFAVEIEQRLLSRVDDQLLGWGGRQLNYDTTVAAYRSRTRHTFRYLRLGSRHSMPEYRTETHHEMWDFFVNTEEHPGHTPFVV